MRSDTSTPEISKFDYREYDPIKVTEMLLDPDFVAGAKKIFRDAGQPAGIRWIERSHQAARKNLYIALWCLERGDGQTAVKALKHGVGRLAHATEALQNGDGTWTIRCDGARSIRVDPEREYEKLACAPLYGKAPERAVFAGNRQLH